MKEENQFSISTETVVELMESFATVDYMLHAATDRVRYGDFCQTTDKGTSMPFV